MLLILLISLASAGRIYPKTSRPILLTRNNAGSSCDYTFYYQISSYIPSDSILEITFPETKYPSDLGLSSCSVTNWNNILLSCTVSSTTVSIQVGELSNADLNNTYNLTIHNIPNPTIGGSSIFKLQIRRGINILDYSDFFAEIGIVQTLTSISSSSVTCISNCIAGKVSAYTITFTTSVVYEQYSRIFIIFPSSLTLPSPVECSSAEIADILCTEKNNVVSVSLLPEEIPSGTSLSFMFTSLVNPAVSGSVGDFWVYSLAPIVNTVLEEKTSISGPSLAANDVIEVVVCPGGPSSVCIGYYPYVALENTQPYTLKITTTNPVPKGGLFFITFHSAFTLRSNYCLILSGLKNQGYTEDDQILCEVDATLGTLSITKFKSFEGGTFTIKIIATNPSTSGTYTGFTVKTYQDTSKVLLIDTGILGYIDVVNLPPPMKWEVSWNQALVVNKIVQETVIFQPETSGMDSSQVSFKMYFPDTFAFTGTVLGYLTPHDEFPELVVTPTKSGSFIEIPSSLVSVPYTNTLNDDNRVRLAGASNTDGILLPSMPGKYFIEMIIVKNALDIEVTLHEIEVLPDVMPGSIKSYSYDIKKKALYEITFTPTITIPEGKVPELPQYSWGTFDIRFPTMNTDLQALWLEDIGTGKSDLDIIPCKAIQNIAPVDGDNLTCRLIKASSVQTSTYATVRVTNFGIIYLNVPVTIHLADLQNIETQDILASVTVATYQITQRVYQELNEVNFTYPRVFYLNSDTSLPKINGRSPAPYGDGLNVIDFSPNTVNVVSTVTFILWTESDILSGGNFYLKFPSTYPLTQDSIACYINYATQLPCYTYPDCRWISILNLQSTMLNHVEYTFTIRYLKNPRHREEPAAAEAVAISSGTEIEYIFFTKFSYLDLGAISPVNVYPSSYKALNVDTSYYWIFTLKNDLPVGSTIILSFPKKDFVLDTTPQPACGFSSILQPTDSISGIGCTITGTSIIITSFLKYTGGKEIVVSVYNILNPSTSRITDYFEIETYDETGKLVDANYIINKITIEAELSVGLFEYVDFYANPSNGLAIADYTISILPSRSLPNGSLIKLIFPQNEFSDLSTDQICSISGGLDTLDSCYGDGVNTVTVVTDADYIKDSLSTAINVTIYGITNFDPKLTSGLLEVEISNTGVVIDSSPDSENHRKVTMGASPELMKLDSLLFYPITASEKAVYNFTFIPTSSFEETCQIVIKFPTSFSRDLAEMVYCYSPEISKKIDTSVKCAVNGRVLTIYDTQGVDITETTNFTISVQHVRNPNVATTEKLIFYSQCGYEMQDYGEESFSASFSQLPSTMYLTSSHSAGSTALYAQESIDLSVHNIGSFVADTNDKIFIDFPIDYNLMFVGKKIICSTELNSDKESKTCSYEPNRVKILAFNDGISTSGLENYTMYLVNIENPSAEQPARFISASFYADSSKQIVYKSYDNLNRIGTFSYAKQGIQVIVNDLESFSINIGTSIDKLSANIPTGAQTSFSIEGEISEPNCEISPNPVKFIIRDFYQYFSVSCNDQAIIGDHYISWTFLGTWPANYWSPIQRTYFTVVSTNNDLISVADIGSVSLGGQSLPIIVSLTHSPESSLTVSFLKIGTIPTNVTIFPSTLTFDRGVLEKSFTVIVAEIAIGLTGRILIKKSGKDADYFTLERSILSYDIGLKDTKLPIIVEYKTLEIGRIYAKFSLIIDEPCNIYWMVGRYGTRAPSTDEVIAGMLENEDGLKDIPIFGYNFTYTKLESNRYYYSLTIEGLLAQTNYTLHVFAQDIGGNFAEYIPTIIFTTLNRYRIATFPMYFTKVLTDTEIIDALAKVADILQINETLVINRTDYSGSTGEAAQNIPYETDDYTSSSGLSRRLGVVYLLDVLIIPDPSQDIKPLDLANSLQDHKAELGTIPYFNTSYTISGQEIYGIAPVFRSKPKLGSVLSGVLTLIDLSLFSDGYITICLILYNQSNYIDPVSYQVNNFIDPHNYDCNMSQVISATPIPTQAFFKDIKSDTEYRVFLSAYNTIQLYPDYMWNYKTISFTTYGMVQDSETNWGLEICVCGMLLVIC